MMRPAWKWTLVAALGAGVGGCATGQGAAAEGAPGPAGMQADGQGEAAPLRRAARAGEAVRELDLTGDKVPDVWTFSVPLSASAEGRRERVTRKELDLNADGRVDQAVDYDAQGRKSREVLDLDFDGRADQVNAYDEQGQLTRKERDLGHDGRPDVWLYFERGSLVRKERDTNGDGKVDAWEYWEGGRVDRIGEDLDGDGEVDRWTRSTPEAP